MSALRPSTDVWPVTEFRANTSAVLDQIQTTKRPVILTQHGRGAAVLLDVHAYEDLISELELLRHLAISEAQMASGDVVSHEEVERRMREKYSL